MSELHGAERGRRVDAVRHFNRFYTRQIGLLREGLLSSPFSLTEARVVYELARHDRTTATELARELRLDLGYVSRILKTFEERGLVDKVRSDVDRRRSLVTLTPSGRDAFSILDAASSGEIQAMLDGLADDDQRRLVASMATIERLLRDDDEPRSPYLLRPHRPGDMGWVVHRHGVLYAEEYGWDERFEALIAEIVARFIRHYEADREHCWIAERDGENVGSVFLVAHPDRARAAQLRLLLVEPRARGLGIGARLVEECTRFARRAGYDTITLWTNSILHAARRLYEREGYRRVSEERHTSFGHDLIAETWELQL